MKLTESLKNIQKNLWFDSLSKTLRSFHDPTTLGIIYLSVGDFLRVLWTVPIVSEGGSSGVLV